MTQSKSRHSATLPPWKALDPAATVQVKLPHAATRPVLKPPHPATVVQRRAPHPALVHSGPVPRELPRAAPVGGVPFARPSQVLQRMEGKPSHEATRSLNDPPQKNAWRHLESAPGSGEWAGSHDILPSIQIAIARHIVPLLRAAKINARLGGSVAALGYSTTRVPDDIDIDIWPKEKHVDVAKKELEQATELICNSSVKEFWLKTASNDQCVYRIDSISVETASPVVIALKIQGRLVRPRFDSYPGDEVARFIKLQLINETAFTFMNKTKDPGQVSVEKYKEVAGLSRLVANCIGRYLQNPSDLKQDRQRVAQMLEAKLRIAERSKVVSVCAKILDYFGSENEWPRAADDRVKTLALLDEIVSGFRSDFYPNELTREVLQLQQLQQAQLQIQVSHWLQQLDPETLKLLGFTK